MIETRVRVLAVREGIGQVEASETGGCSACSARSACAVSGLGRYFDTRRKPVAIACADARVGDELVVGIAEADFLKAGLLAYLLPACLAVLAGAGADWRGLGDLGAVLAAGAGVVLGLLVARRVAPSTVMHARPLTFTSSQGEPP